MRKGVAVSPGIAVARAHRLDQIPAGDVVVVDAASIPLEVARFEQACLAAAADLDAICQRVSREIGEDAAAIFRAHRLLLRDPAFIGKVRGHIQKRQVDARAALHATLAEFSELFAKIPDDYLRERLADIKDVVGRIENHLVADVQQTEAVTEPVILVAPEILPSQAVMFERFPVAGIVTETGGTTGHAAILARSLGIPAVSGLPGLLKEVRSGDLLAMDGREGMVLVNPGPEVEAAYRKLQREYVDLRDRLFENADHPAVTAKGEPLELLANVNGSADVIAATRVGATGVGLFRTEYLFLAHVAVPNEEEQFNAYRAIVEAAPRKTVTIRTLDLGGDKLIPFLGDHAESNPFLGWRSIRLTTAFPELFQTQLRAILRAATVGSVKLLFPMVSTVEEVRLLKRVIRRAMAALASQGTQFADNVPIGVMIEVPAAALCIDHLLDEVDFVSIGSNDLIQYVMAADRDNPKVSHLCDPCAPAVLRLLHQVVSACRDRGTPVTLCGEMAGRPLCFLPLLGMGLRQFSMSPAFVPTIKELARCVSIDDAQNIAGMTLKLKTAREVRRFLTERLSAICPKVAMLDTLK
jgi:phosphoenolpyruvate-protein phosphotransferase